MLLECCPPPEVRERRRRDRAAAATAAAMAQSTTAKEDDDDGGHGESDGPSSSRRGDVGDDDAWPEECHVIAPCTHNGTCPMSRHQRDHGKRNSQFAKCITTSKQARIPPVYRPKSINHGKDRRIRRLLLQFRS